MSPSQKRHRRGFEYDPLQPHSFRLLEIIPGKSESADIYCKLRHYTLDSAPSYEALSYTWGTEENTCRISLDGLPFHIRPNLRNVLRQLRQRGIKIIWVDAICIDQSSTHEKNVQVPLMGDVYTRAKRVIAWLGEESSDSGMALDFIPDLTMVAKLDIEFIWLVRLRDDEFLQGLISLFHLFSRDWWQRMWIIQEVALAWDVLVLCGSRSIPWSIFHCFILAWMDIKHTPHHMSIDTRQITVLRGLGMLVSGYAEALTSMRQSHQAILSAPGPHQLPNLLWSFKYRLVTNPKDKIYGLLGLLNNHGVQVDYDKPSEDVYLSFFSSCLVEDKGLDWFRWMTGERCEPKGLCLPSWVPDFGPRTVVPISSFLPNQDLGEKQRAFLTGGRDRSRSWSTIQFGDDPHTLILRGHLFDVVSQCGSIYPLMDDILLAGHETEPVLSDWEKMKINTQSEIYNSPFAKEDAFWRTILTDRQIEGLHFKENAGRDPAKRLPARTRFIPPTNPIDEQLLLQAMGNRQLCLNGRRFCITKKGYFCLLPATASEGDLIYVLLGGEVPYVLRRIDDQTEDLYTMVGECYVHGIMDGEVVAEGKDVAEFRLR